MIRERMLKLEQTLERLFGGQPPREPLEIRRAVIDTLLGQVQPVGRGRRLLPFGRAVVHVAATDATERRVLKEALDPADLTREVVKGVERAGGHAPADFTVTVRLTRERGKDWTPGARFHVTVSPAEASKQQPAAESPAATVVLRVIEGEARPRTLTSDAARINLGRQVDVLDQSGRPVRHNDVAFVGEDEVSRSVSRAHAHIAFERTSGSHRLFDENSAHGTQVEREGRRITIPAGRDGLKLRAGDTIHVGRAVVRFDVRQSRTGPSSS